MIMLLEDQPIQTVICNPYATKNRVKVPIIKWTEEQNRLLIHMAKNGYSPQEIADSTGRTKAAVQTRKQRFRRMGTI